jgi:hypothetical protein
MRLRFLPACLQALNTVNCSGHSQDKATSLMPGCFVRLYPEARCRNIASVYTSSEFHAVRTFNTLIGLDEAAVALARWLARFLPASLRAIQGSVKPKFCHN